MNQTGCFNCLRYSSFLGRKNAYGIIILSLCMWESTCRFHFLHWTTDSFRNSSAGDGKRSCLHFRPKLCLVFRARHYLSKFVDDWESLHFLNRKQFVMVMKPYAGSHLSGPSHETVSWNCAAGQLPDWTIAIPFSFPKCPWPLSALHTPQTSCTKCQYVKETYNSIPSNLSTCGFNTENQRLVFSPCCVCSYCKNMHRQRNK
jgi:hypothetical protein